MLAFKLAWRNIWRNRRRTVITTLSIVVAVFLSVLTRSTQEGQYDNMIENTVGKYIGHIQVHARGFWDEPTLENSMAMSDTLHHTLASTPGVISVVPRLESYALSAARRQSRPAMVLGIDPAAERALSDPPSSLQAGRYFDSPSKHGAILGEGLYDRLGAVLGDSLVLLGQGWRGMTAAGLYPIRGVVSYANPELNDNLVYLPLETAQELFSAPDRLTAAALMLEDPRTLEETVSLLRSRVDTSQYEVMSWKEMMPELQQAIQADRGSGIIILGVLYMVVGFGILGTVLMMIAERSFEFGVMLSVGTPRSTLFFILAIEVLMIALMGAGFGILLSLPVIWYLNLNPINLEGAMESAMQQYAMDPVLFFSMDPGIFTSQAITVFVITLLFSLVPLVRAARKEPVESMRS
ncbi:MAG: FtsX-like permease family protein [Balneolaceae bacterium]|nr:FtsX-like permease family protein [Balneolaceae bacterium]